MSKYLCHIRVVTWNLGYWTPGRYNGVANRQAQWQFLLNLQPDVACLQECRPEDLDRVQGGADYEVIGTIPPRWTACSAVVVRKDLEPRAVTPADHLSAIGGYVSAATLSTTSGRLLVASVHAPARDFLDPPLTEAVHAELRRPGATMAGYNDVAFAALDALPKGDGFVFAGDWNTARLFDTNSPATLPTAAEFFRRAEERGWFESLRVQYPEEVRTYLKAGSKPYQDDHVFTDATTHRRLRDSDVLYKVGDRDTVELSDHAPVVVDFDFP